MAYARVSYTGNGSTKIFTVPFPYIDPAHVEVRVGGVLKTVATDYTWLTTSTIQFLTAPAAAKTIFLLRNTPKQDRLVNYQDAAVLREADLDLDSDQSFYIVQEALDAAENTQAIETFIGGVDYTAGVTTSLTLGAGDIEMSNLLVLFDAAAQQQTEYTLAGGVITFDSAIPVGVLQVQVSFAVPMSSGLINGSVTTPVLADLAVSEPKLADGAVSTRAQADLSVTAAKLNDQVFSGLTEVAPAVDDYVPIADTSDSGKKKKSLVSSILSLAASATTVIRGLVTLATNNEVVTGTSTTKAVTPSSLGYHGGVVKTWVTFNGATGATLSGNNVFSVARNAAGDYTITFTVPFATNNYCILGTAENNDTTGACIVTRHPSDVRTTSACQVKVRDDAGTTVDSAYVSVAFLGYW